MEHLNIFKVIEIKTKEEYLKTLSKQEVFLKGLGKSVQYINNLKKKNLRLIENLPRYIRVEKVFLNTLSKPQVWLYKGILIPKTIINKKLNEDDEKRFPELFL